MGGPPCYKHRTITYVNPRGNIYCHHVADPTVRRERGLRVNAGSCIAAGGVDPGLRGGPVSLAATAAAAADGDGDGRGGGGKPVDRRPFAGTRAKLINLSFFYFQIPFQIPYLGSLLI